MTRWHSVGQLIAVVIVASIVASCGQSGGGAPAATASAAAAASRTAAPASTAPATLAPVDPLNISFGTPSALYGAAVVAMGNDLFTKNGVRVNVVSWTALTVGTSQLVGGEIDLLLTGAPQGTQIALQGKPVSIIYNLADYTGYTTAYFSKPQIKSMADLTALGKNCSVAIEPPGTSFRAFGKAVSRAYNLGCSYIESASPPAALAAVVGGSADAAIVAYDTGLAAAQANKGNMILDPSKLTAADAQKIVPTTYPAIAVMTLSSTRQAKREAIQRFVRALVAAQALMEKATSAQLAETAVGIPGKPFGTASVADMTAAYDGARRNFPAGNQAGSISASAWSAALAGFASDWELPNFRPADPSLKYETAVDMSFLNAAR